MIRFYASRTIEAGEELTIFYGANLWFEDPSGPRRPESPPEDEDNVFSKLML